jgi:F420-dependent oxidoreductase-like protein
LTTREAAHYTSRVRLGLSLGYSGSRLAINMPLVREADRLGFHAVWTAEAYGSDAVTPLAWIAGQTERIRLATGIMQMAARTPAMTAMTATTLDQLSGGRALLGLGVSGPQVVEGWHGVRFGKPMVRTREYVEILRAIWARERPLEHDGEHYQIPYRGPGASGLGKPLKSILHGRRIPIYIAAIGPKSVAQAAEIADGWLPIFYSPYRAPAVYRDALAAGFARAGGGKGLRDFDIAVTATVIVGDDVAACLAFVKPMLALYIGGMGARGRNFYNDLACRYGFEDAARRIQDLYLAGRKDEAAAAVPDALADEVSLVGPKERIRDRLAAWRASPVGTLNLATAQVEALRLMAELAG